MRRGRMARHCERANALAKVVAMARALPVTMAMSWWRPCGARALVGTALVYAM